MSAFRALQGMELERARSLHPRVTNSYHEGYAVILEEVDELWDEVRKKKPDAIEVGKELVQIAAMCEKMAFDLGVIK